MAPATAHWNSMDADHHLSDFQALARIVEHRLGGRAKSTRIDGNVLDWWC